MWKPWYVFWAVYNAIPFGILNNFAFTLPRVEKFLKMLREDELHEGKRWGWLGFVRFCWVGSWRFWLRRGKKTDGGRYLVDVAFAGHPSGISLPTDIEMLTAPMSVAIGDVDFTMGKEDVIKLKEGLEKMEGRGKGSGLTMYAGAKHGFAIRADLKDPKEKELADQAEDQAVKWMVEGIESFRKGEL